MVRVALRFGLEGTEVQRAVRGSARCPSGPGAGGCCPLGHRVAAQLQSSCYRVAKRRRSKVAELVPPEILEARITIDSSGVMNFRGIAIVDGNDKFSILPNGDRLWIMGQYSPDSCSH